MKTENTVIETLTANSIRDTIWMMEKNTPDEALHLAEQLREQMEDFIGSIQDLEGKLPSDKPGSPGKEKQELYFEIDKHLHDENSQVRIDFLVDAIIQGKIRNIRWVK